MHVLGVAGSKIKNDSQPEPPSSSQPYERISDFDDPRVLVQDRCMTTGTAEQLELRRGRRLWAWTGKGGLI